MKRSLLILVAFALTVLTTGALFAQEVITEVVTNPFPWTEVLTGLSVILAPIVIWLVKMIPIMKIPKGLLPYLATGLGTVITQIVAWQANTGLELWQSILLGLAAVGLRELVDRIKQALQKLLTPTPAP